VARAAGGSRDAYRPPSQQRPDRLGSSSPSSSELDAATSTMSVAAATGDLRRPGRPGRRELRTRDDERPSLLIPDFPSDGRSRATRQAGGQFPDVQRVLGDEAAVDLGDGGGLTFGQLPLLALVLVLVSSLLLIGALLPPGVIARTPLSPVRFARIRQPLALAAIVILMPVVFASLAAALS
jgi:hypothetical protein